MLTAEECIVTRPKHTLPAQDISGDLFILYKDRKFTALGVTASPKATFTTKGPDEMVSCFQLLLSFCATGKQNSLSRPMAACFVSNEQ